MALLYDIYYEGRGMDSNCPLPSKPPRGMIYAVCKNGPDEVLVPYEGRYIGRHVDTMLGM